MCDFQLTRGFQRLAYKAFLSVVCARQTGKESLVGWLRLEAERTWPWKLAEAKVLKDLDLGG